MSPVAAIILAAGRGLRFGPEPKLLARYRGKPLVRHVAEAALASSAGSVLAVLGHEAERVAAALDGLAVTIVHNPLYADGLSTSLQAGFAALPRRAQAAVILLGDMPLVSGALIDGLVSAWRDAEPVAVVPTTQGRRGNPVLLSRALAPEIRTLSGDRGAAPLLEGRTGVLELPIDDMAIHRDVDTPAAWRDLAG